MGDARLCGAGSHRGEGKFNGEQIRGGTAQGLHPALEEVAAQPLLGELLAQAVELAKALGLSLGGGLGSSGVLGFGDLQLGGDRRVDVCHLLLGAAASLCDHLELLQSPLQLFVAFTQQCLALLALLSLLLQLRAETGDLGLGPIEHGLGAMGDLGGELAGKGVDGEVGGELAIHGAGEGGPSF